jgi:hypothetical protein
LHSSNRFRIRQLRPTGRESFKQSDSWQAACLYVERVAVINTATSGEDGLTSEPKQWGRTGPILLGFSRHSQGGVVKKHAFTLIGVLSLLVAAGSAFAQIQAQTVHAKIPFKFVVNKQSLPAGDYEISRYGTNGDLILVRSQQEKLSILTMASGVEALKPSEKTKLIFKRYGDRYFLSQVWVEGNNAGRQLPKSPHESEVALDFHSQDVVVLASLR